MRIGDIFRDKDQPWMYPFTKVKKDPIEGWFFDWSIDSGMIPDPELVSIGDLVQDVSLNATPYWKVTQVVDSLIYVDPYGDNPFLSGVGAGGKPLTELDFDVFTGEAEKKYIDRILKSIHEKQYADCYDIKYILLGTMKVRFGPNGAEGGWYTATDWGTRGHNKGMSPVEIMMADAQTLKKLGLEVPPNALDGTLKPDTWSRFVSGTDELIPELIFPGEDWDDPLLCARWVLTHPQPQIRKRNAKALRELLHRQEEFSEAYRALWDNLPNRETTPEDIWEEARRDIRSQEENLRETWKNDPEIEELCHSVAERLFYSQHPTFTRWEDFDAYWFTKEIFINIARDECWIDILYLYAQARDTTNRKYVAWALTTCEDLEGLVQMADTETHGEPLDAALSGIKKLDKAFYHNYIEENLQRLKALSQRKGKDDPTGYYKDDIRNRINKAIESLAYFREHGEWSWFLT